MYAGVPHFRGLAVDVERAAAPPGSSKESQAAMHYRRNTHARTSPNERGAGARRATRRSSRVHSVLGRVSPPQSNVLN